MKGRTLRFVILASVLFSFCTFATAASTLTLDKPSVKVQNNNDYFTYSVYESGSLQYALSDCEITYKLVPSPVKDCSSITYKVLCGNDEVIKETTVEDDDFSSGSLSITVKAQKSGIYTISASAKFGKESVSMSDTQYKVIICEKPTNTDVDWNNNKEVVWSDTTTSLRINPKGDDNCAFTYKWTRDGVSASQSKSLNNAFNNLISNNEQKTISVKLVLQYGPKDASNVVWYKREFKYTYDVWKVPVDSDVKVDIIEGGGFSKENVTLYSYPDYDSNIYGERYFEASSTLNSGKGWIYNWKLDNIIKSSGSKFIPEDQVIKTYSYTLVASYRPDDNLSVRQIIKNNVKYEVLAVPVITPADKITDSSTQVIWADTKHTISMSTEGGNTQKWEHSWKIGNDTKGSSSELKNFTLEANSQDVASEYEIKVHSSNKDANGVVWFENDYTRYYEVWKQPSLSPELNSYVGEKKCADKNTYVCSGYDADEYGKREIQIDNLTGKSDFWSYQWTVNSNSVKYYDSFTLPVENVETPKTAKYNVKVIYKPDNLVDTPYERTLDEITLTTYPKPSISANIDNRYVVWNNTNNSIIVGEQGGCNWSFAWTFDDELDQSFIDNKWNKTYSKPGEYSVSCQATNTDPHGDLLYSQEFSTKFKVFTYPRVGIMESLLKVYRNYERQAVIVDSVAENGYSWQLNWVVNDKDIQNSNSLECKILYDKLTTDALGMHETKMFDGSVNLINQPTGMADSLAFNETIPFTIKFWPEPSVSLTYNNGVILQDNAKLDEFFDGDSLIVTTDVSDCIEGDASLWNFKWEDFDGDSKTPYVTTTQDLVCEQINKIDNFVNHKYVLTASNSLDNYGPGDRQAILESCFFTTVKPQLSVDIDNLIVRYEDLPAEYRADIYHDSIDSVYHVMQGCIVTYPLVCAPSKSIVVESCKLSFDNGLTMIDRDQIDTINDSVIVLKSGTFNEPGEYKLHIGGTMKYKDDENRNDTLNFSQSPMIKVWPRPEAVISTENGWDESRTYTVWDTCNQVISDLDIKVVSTNEWKFTKLDVCGNSTTDEHTYIKHDFTISDSNENQLENNFIITAKCFAPDKKTLWYQKTFTRKFSVWRAPELSGKQKFSYADIEHDYTDTLNVCTKFYDKGDVVLSVIPQHSSDLLNWNYDWYEVTGEGENENFEYKNQTNLTFKYSKDDDIVGFRKFKVKAKASPESELLLKDTVNFEKEFIIKVWPIQSLNDCTSYYQKDGNKYLSVQVPDTVPSMVLKENGDISDKLWNILWYDENGNYCGSKNIDVRSENAGYTPVFKTYNADVFVGFDALNYYDEEKISYTVKVYPEIDVWLDVNEFEDNKYNALYSGDTITWHPTNNYSDFGTWKWNFSFVDFQSVELANASDTMSLPDNFVVENIDNDTSVDIDTLICKVSCRSDEGLPLRVSQPAPQPVTIWPMASIAVPDCYQRKDDEDQLIQLLGNGSIDLKPELKVVDDTQFWQFDWSDSANPDMILGGNNKYVYTATKNPEKPTVFSYVLNSSYQRDGARRIYYEPLYFFWKEYRPIVEPNIKSYPNEQVRDQDEFTLNLVADLASANPDGWTFTWRMDGNDLEQTTEPEFPVTFDIQSEESYCAAGNYKKQQKTCSYSVLVKNANPVNKDEYWYFKEIKFNPVTVYRRPMQPEELRLKGNGTTGIYIAYGGVPSTYENNSNMPQETFYSSNDYKFVFGVGDDQGYPAQELSYYHFDSSVEGKPWVCTLWEYNDGFKCYSDTVYGSAISKMAVGEVVFDGNHFSVDLENPATANARLYDSGGKLVRQYSFGYSTHFDENVDTSGLKAGIYLIKIEIGSTSETRKFTIK